MNKGPPSIKSYRRLSSIGTFLVLVAAGAFLVSLTSIAYLGWQEERGTPVEDRLGVVAGGTFLWSFFVGAIGMQCDWKAYLQLGELKAMRKAKEAKSGLVDCAICGQELPKRHATQYMESPSYAIFSACKNCKKEFERRYKDLLIWRS